MASGFVCDRCGRAIFPKENSTFVVSLHGGNHSIVTVNRDVDAEQNVPAYIDLCPPCADAVADIITRRIITKTTNMDAWVVSAKDDTDD